MDALEEIQSLEAEQRRAFVARDLERLGALWSDALLVHSPLNRVHPKRLVLDLLAAGTIAHVSFEADIERLEAVGDHVVVMGGERIVNEPGGPTIHRRFTNVWRHENGTWRMVLRHANLIPAGRP